MKDNYVNITVLHTYNPCLSCFRTVVLDSPQTIELFTSGKGKKDLAMEQNLHELRTKILRIEYKQKRIHERIIDYVCAEHRLHQDLKNLKELATTETRPPPSIKDMELDSAEKMLDFIDIYREDSCSFQPVHNTGFNVDISDENNLTPSKNVKENIHIHLQEKLGPEELLYGEEYRRRILNICEGDNTYQLLKEVTAAINKNIIPYLDRSFIKMGQDVILLQNALSAAL